jgi:hypothetical protein
MVNVHLAIGDAIMPLAWRLRNSAQDREKPVSALLDFKQLAWPTLRDYGPRAACRNIEELELLCRTSDPVLALDAESRLSLANSAVTN